VTIGDSITAGIGSSSGGYPAMLEAKLRAAGYNVSVRNEGIPGADSGMADINFDADVRGANIVLIMIGTNDIGCPSCCIRPYDCQTISHISSMLDKALRAGITPIISTVTPKRAGDILDWANPGIEDLNAQIYAVAAQRNVRVVDNHRAILTQGGNALFADKHHLNDRGYDVMANEWFNVLVSLL
jgi:lysophospholipase L1-like esterase